MQCRHSLTRAGKGRHRPRARSPPMNTTSNACCAPEDPCCPPASIAPTAAETEAEANAQLARYAKALAHPARVAIIRLLMRQDGCIAGDIVDQLPLAQSTVSQHLKQLKRRAAKDPPMSLTISRLNEYSRIGCTNKKFVRT